MKTTLTLIIIVCALSFFSALCRKATFETKHEEELNRRVKHGLDIASGFILVFAVPPSLIFWLWNILP